jgi:hypothetical protein
MSEDTERDTFSPKELQDALDSAAVSFMNEARRLPGCLGMIGTFVIGAPNGQVLLHTFSGIPVHYNVEELVKFAIEEGLFNASKRRELNRA